MQGAPVYSGPPTGHPDATRLGTWTGWVQNQDLDTERAIRNALRGDTSDLIGEVILEMDDGAVITGNVTGPVGIITGYDPSVRMLLSNWDEDVFQHAVVDIDRDGRITVTVRENPPESGQDFRPAAPMITSI